VGVGVKEFASCNKCLIETINRLPYLSKKPCKQGFAIQKKQRKKENKWRKWNKQTHEIAFFAPFETLGIYPTIYWKLDNNLEVTKQPPSNKQQHIQNIHKMLPSFCLPTNMGPFKSATRKLCTLFFVSHKHGSLQELHAFEKLVFLKKNIWASIRGRIYSILALSSFPGYFFLFFWQITRFHQKAHLRENLLETCSQNYLSSNILLKTFGQKCLLDFNFFNIELHLMTLNIVIPHAYSRLIVVSVH